MCLLSMLLVACFGSPKYSAREAAYAALLALGDRATPAFCMGSNHPDPEIALRCQRLLEERQYLATAEKQRWLTNHLNCYGPLPWLDALPQSTPHRQEILSRHLYFGENRPGDGFADEPEPWGPWRRATRLYLRELVSEGASRQEIELTLQLLSSRSALYAQGKGYPD